MSRSGTFQSRKLRELARGKPCVLCAHDGFFSTETTVLAHLPGSFYGMPAGVAQKTHDWLGAHLCDEHHRKMDTVWRRDTDIRMMALCLTLERLFTEKSILVSCDR